MLTVTKSFTFDAAHRLSFHKGKCRNLHGHTWRVDVTATGRADSNGIVVDFGDMKTLIGDWLNEEFDHAVIAHVDDEELQNALIILGTKCKVIESETTSENLAEYIYRGACSLLKHVPLVNVAAVKVHEGPNSVATFVA